VYSCCSLGYIVCSLYMLFKFENVLFLYIKYILPYITIYVQDCSYVKTYYSRIPLIWHRCDWTGARLLNILDYQTVPILTKFFIDNFLLLHSQPSEHVHLSVILISSLTDFAFPIILGPVTDFHLEHISVNHFYNTLSNC
jgi:hypothetical protein